MALPRTIARLVDWFRKVFITDYNPCEARSHSLPAPSAHISGAWGENVAVEYLRDQGYAIIERNSRPNSADRRQEIDIVAKDRKTGEVVFVEVKQHSRHFEGERRLRSITERKKRVLWKAGKAWRYAHHLKDPWRWDVIEIYGKPGSKCELDHIKRISLKSYHPGNDYISFST